VLLGALLTGIVSAGMAAFSKGGKARNGERENDT